MNFLDKKLICTATALILCIFVNASETIFYKLVSVEGDRSINIAGGQFITFVGDLCFDSNKSGVTVNNGKLNKNLYQSTSEKVVYLGTSFFGPNSKYIFTNSNNNLKIVSAKGSCYYYVKTTAPHNCVTCSLIKSESEQGDDSYIPSYNQSPPSYQSTTPNYNPSNQSSGDNPSNSTQYQPTKKRCPHCINGRITREDAPAPSFGINTLPKRQCNECGIWYNPNVVNHYHIRCRHCGGTGYIKL